ncbi:hypothetical protein H5410_012913 [Solanum commersonii]|uniref:Uncharacterized protein n=1 Tax=Solanum commersonii TaxID=4109 RepID=A0A9J6AU62_SOLCO|nr:hypothetical protein H5410_012913 [Solanum commersonii]
MNNHGAEIGKDDVPDFESHNPHIPIVGSNIPCSSQSSRVNNVRDDEFDFYKEMTFKKKKELTNSLKIACLKKDFRLKKYFENRLHNGKDPSTRDMSNQLRIELGCKVSYWKIYKGIEHAKSNVRGTHEHIYAIVSTIYPASHYGCYMRHLGENIRNNFHNSKVVTHFYKSAKAYDKCEFNDHFSQIRDLVPNAADNLERIGSHTWSRAFCPGNKYNIMTSNIAESVNSMFDVGREFPIVILFDEINRRFALLFHQMRMELVNSANRFIHSIEKDISKYVNAGNKLLAHQIANYKFSVTGHDDNFLLGQNTLSTYHGSSSSLIGNQIYEYSSPYYSVEKYIMTYCEEIHLVPPEDSWIVPLDVIKREIPPPYVDQSKLGRRRYKRRRGVGESFPTRKNKCSKSSKMTMSKEKLLIEIVKAEPLKVRRCRHNLRNILGGMWVPEPHLLGGRPIYCTVHQFEQIRRRNGWPMGSDNEDDIHCDLELDYVVKFLSYTTVKKNYIESLPRELLIDIVERIASYSLKDLMRVKLRVLNEVANEPSVYHKYDFFKRSDSNGLGILSQVADGCHIGASYVLAIISIFNGGESMREGMMFIANITPLKLKICREKLLYTLYGWVPEPHLLGERLICCTIQILHFRCELCRCDLEINEENACNFFIWRDCEDVDILSKFVILRLTNRIKELEIDDENHIKRNNSSVATDASNVTTYHLYVATYDHLRHMLLQITHILLHMIHILLHMTHMLLHMRHILLQMTHMLLRMTHMLLQMTQYIATYETYVATKDLYVVTNETYVTTFDQVLALNITSHTMYLLSI